MMECVGRSCSRDRDAGASSDPPPYVSSLQKELTNLSRKLEAVEGDVKKVGQEVQHELRESAQENEQVLTRRLEEVQRSVRSLESKAPEVTQNIQMNLNSLGSAEDTARRLQALEAAHASLALAPPEIEDRLVQLERAHEKLTAAVQFHNERLQISSMKDNHVNDLLERLEEIEKWRATVRFEEIERSCKAVMLEDMEKWRAKIEASIKHVQICDSPGEASLSKEPAISATEPRNVTELANVTDLNKTPEQKDSDGVGVQFVKAAIRRSRHYEFCDSVYDAAFFICEEYLPVSSSIMIAVGFLVNLFMQMYIVVVISGQTFTGEPFPEEDRDGLDRWRASEAHEMENVDPFTGHSLLSRVCNSDMGLSNGASQMVAVDEIRAYLFKRGRYLCLVAILLWLFCCAWEIRKTTIFVLALCNKPKSAGWRSVNQADEKGIHVLELSMPRFILGLGVAFCRFTIASLLLTFGSQWLARTESMVDLLLNASALSFVLQIDEEIFGVLMPSPVMGLICSLQPMAIPAKEQYPLVSLFMLVLAIAFPIIMNFTVMQSTVNQMGEVLEILCSDNTHIDFMRGTNALGWVIFAESVPFASEEGTRQPESKLIQAKTDTTRLIINRHPDASLYAQDLSVSPELNLNTLKQESLKTVSQFVMPSACIDIPWNSGAASDVRLGARLFVATGLESFKGKQTCAEIEQHCRDANVSKTGQNARYMCPVTCGCADPMSGLWDLAAPAAGCPKPECDKQLEGALRARDFKCEDKDTSEQGIKERWTFMLERMQALNQINSSVLVDLDGTGCNALRKFETQQRFLLCSIAILGSESLYHGAAAFCPVSCGCKRVPKLLTGVSGSLCPSSCRIMTRNSSL